MGVGEGTQASMDGTKNYFGDSCGVLSVGKLIEKYLVVLGLSKNNSKSTHLG